MSAPCGLESMNVADYLLDPARRQEYVTPVFETVAPSYDRFTRWSTLGFDMVWKRELLSRVRRLLESDHCIVDLACGTGDLAFALASMVPRGRVIGTDITPAMLELAEAKRSKRKHANVEFRRADNMALPFADASINVVTGSYALRNCSDLRGLLTEVHRVLKPGGCFASLELVRPDNVLWRRLFLKGMFLACSFHGWLWHKQPRSYGYLAESIALFVTGSELVRLTRAAGFADVDNRSWLGGAVSLLLARKPVPYGRREDHVV